MAFPEEGGGRLREDTTLKQWGWGWGQIALRTDSGAATSELKQPERRGECVWAEESCGTLVPLTAKWPSAVSSADGLVSGRRKLSPTEGQHLQPQRQARFVEGAAVGHLLTGLG